MNLRDGAYLGSILGLLLGFIFHFQLFKYITKIRAQAEIEAQAYLEDEFCSEGY